MNWYKQDFKPKSNILLICLSSVYDGKINLSKFEWMNSTKDINVKKLYIRDPVHGWWQTYFDGIGIGPHCVAKFINEKVKESDVKRTLIIGHSLGGYGAILFSCLCELDLAISIAPQTYLDDRVYRKYKLNEKYSGLDINKEETDLKVILERYGNNKTKYYLYYGSKHVIDKNYANRIAGYTGVKLFPIESDRHGIARIMRDSGVTNRVISDFINGKI